MPPGHDPVDGEGDEADGQHAFQRQERDPGAGCYKSAELRKHKMQGDYNN